MMLARSFASRRSISTLPCLCQKIKQTGGMVKAGVIDGVQSLPRNVEGKDSGTEIQIAIKSLKQPLGLPPCTRKIALPELRSLYTVLRSTHVDKKSREQFHMKVKKQLLIIKAEGHASKKYFWLKRQRTLGAQHELQFSCKTRLDKEKLQRLL